MRFRRIPIFCLFLLSTPLAAAELPASWSAGLGLPSEPAGSRQIEPMDLEALAAEDAINEALGRPPRFAVPRHVSISPSTSGIWVHLDDGTSVWRYRVQAGNAVSLNFGFRNVWMPEGASLFFYTPDAANRGKPDRYELIGPFGTDINETHGQFWTPLLAAADVVIELNIPSALRNQVSLELFRIGQGYRGFGLAAEGYRQDVSNLSGPGKSSCGSRGVAKSGSCNTDVACLGPDDPWNGPRRAVGAYSVGGSLACTGSLVNNTAEDQRMLFVTATHCTVDQSNAASVVVYWNYEWPTCRTPGEVEGGNTNPPDPNSSQSGAEFLAATLNPFDASDCLFADECSDMTLLELDDPANEAFNLFWAGWDRSSLAANCGPEINDSSTENLCASIHHPSVDEKRITFVEDDLTQADIALAQDVHWLARWDPTPPILPGIPSPQPVTLPPSVTEPGSSGSPLYNAEKLLVGVLSGGASACGATGDALSDQYGQLAHAWDGLGTQSTRMRDYLDPEASGAFFMNGLEETMFADGFEGSDGLATPPQLNECIDYMPTQVSGNITDDWSVVNETDTFSGLLATPPDPGGGFWQVSVSTGAPATPAVNVFGSDPNAGGVTAGAASVDEQSATASFLAYPNQSYTVETTERTNAPTQDYPWDYNLSYSFQSRVDCYEPNDVRQDARWIPSGEPIEAFALAGYGNNNAVVNDAKSDWYRVNVSGPDLRVELLRSPSDIRMTMTLFYSGEAVPAPMDFIVTEPGGINQTGRLFYLQNIRALEPGTYFLHVIHDFATRNVAQDTPIPDHWNTKYQLIVSELN